MADETLDRESQETWESTTGGTTYVQVRDPANPRAYITKKIGGPSKRRLTLTVGERLYNQELVGYESTQHDPFTNGLLIRTNPKPTVEEKGRFEVTDDELVALLAAGSDEEFEQLVAKTDSEVVLRRMLFLAERNATMWRFNLLTEAVAERYSVGKTSRVVKEYFDDLAKHEGASI